MRSNRLLPLILVSVVVGALIAGASASAAGSHTASALRLKFVPERWYTWACQSLDVPKLSWS